MPWAARAWSRRPARSTRSTSPSTTCWPDGRRRGWSSSSEAVAGGAVSMLRTGTVGRRIDRAPAAALRLSVPLGLAASVAAVGSLCFPSLLSGAAVTVGNLRGTALVVLVVALPLLTAGVLMTRGGSVRGLVLWLGAVAYLSYQGLMFGCGTPINALFLPYVALLGLGLWSMVVLVPATAAGWAVG